MNETEFGYRIRQALNEGLERMDYKTAFRLERARKAALARYRPAPAAVAAPTLATAGGPVLEEPAVNGGGWLHRLGLAAPLIALLIGFVAIHQWQRAKTIDELAAIDFAFLLDEAPIEAYADKGFGVVLKYGLSD
jgi:hypothetical protein